MAPLGLSSDSVRLRALARRLLATFRPRFPTTTFLLGGSAAAGHSDRHSDLDLYAIAPVAPAPAIRAAWLGELADPGATQFLAEPITAGGCADTVRIAGVAVTVIWRAAAEVEQAVAELCQGARLEPEHEVAYGHELRQAVALQDPFDLLPAWRQALAVDLGHRAERLEARAAGQLRWAAATDPADAALGLYPALVSLLQTTCARHGSFYPGPKRCPRLVAAPGIAALIELAIAPQPVSARLAALAATVPPAPAVRAELAPLESSLPLLEQGADAAGGRLLVACERQDPLLFLHYLHRSLAALARLGAPPDTIAELAAPGARPEVMALVRERLLAVWRELVVAERRRRPGWDSSYAEAALNTGRG